MIKGKAGWIRMIEAFVAILIIGGVILVIINSQNESKDVSIYVYEDEMMMLQAVQLNESLRTSVLNIDYANLPVDSENSGFPADVNATLERENPGYLKCKAQICWIEDDCVIENNAAADIYTNQIIIFANLEIYSPRKITLSCILEKT